MGSVVLLRGEAEREGTDPYCEQLIHGGYSPSCIPVLSFNFLNIDKLAGALRNPSDYSGIILTSPRAVEATKKALLSISQNSDSDVLTPSQDLPAFVVGEATGKAAAELGFVTQGESSGNADTLAPIIAQHYLENGDVKPLLFPAGNLRRDVLNNYLSDRNIFLENITVYETCAEPNISKNMETFLQTIGIPEFLVYYSPSGLTFTWDILHQLKIPLMLVKFVAIGVTTQKALEQKCINVAAVASKPTPEGLLAALIDIH